MTGTALPAGVASILLADDERWRTLLHETAHRHGGAALPDDLGAVFSRASAALAAALDAQRALGAAGTAARMAIHAAEAPSRDGTLDLRPLVLRCAQLRDLARPGQVLTSAAVAALVTDEATVVPVGTMRLRGRRHAERIFQVVHPDLSAHVGLLDMASPARHPGPTPVTSFIGREGELAELGELLADHRVVTLTGAGGVGKTRLAAEALLRRDDADDEETLWVELAPLATPEAVPSALAGALDIREVQADPMGRALELLRDRRGVLVLDNCEHVLAAARDLVERVSQDCPGMVVLATSREPLGLEAELVWQVRPLSLPGSGAAIATGDAVLLFAERAAHARPGFHLDARTARVVTALCQRLDGLPLAIELAAARMRALTPERILEGLERRFALLAGGTDGLAHQQTLAASLAWSHDLLTAQQQVLLRRLSVFEDRFTADDVEAVCGTDPLPPADCLLLLADLVDRSLVVFDGEHHRLLQTVAAFAAERLADAGEEAALRAAHLTHFVALGAALADELERAPRPEVLDSLEVARPNIHAAIDRAVDMREDERALTLTADMALFWQMRAHYGESLTLLRHVLEHTADAATAARARVLWATGQLALFGMDRDHGYGLAEAGAAIAMADDTGAPGVRARAMTLEGFVTIFAAPGAALAPLRDARRLAEEAGDVHAARMATAYLAFAAAFGAGDPDDMRGELDRLRGVVEESASPYWEGWEALSLGFADYRGGRLRDVVARLGPAVDRARELGDSQLEFFAVMSLADAHADLGDVDATERVVARSASWQDRTAIGRAETARLRRCRSLLAAGDTGAVAAEIAAVEPSIRALGFDFVLVELLAVVSQYAVLTGDLAAARAAADEAQATVAGLDNPWFRMVVVAEQGRVARAEGRAGVAEDAYHAALALCAGHGWNGRAATILDALAGLALAADSPVEAARLSAAAGALHERTGLRRAAADATRAATDAAAIADAVGPERFARIVAEAQRLDLAAMAEEAVRGRDERGRPEQGWDALTPAELQIVELVAEGCTNAQIGERLFITTGTVKVHLHNIFGKLDVRRRSELAAQATARRLAASGDAPSA